MGVKMPCHGLRLGWGLRAHEHRRGQAGAWGDRSGRGFRGSLHCCCGRHACTQGSWDWSVHTSRSASGLRQSSEAFCSAGTGSGSAEVGLLSLPSCRQPCWCQSYLVKARRSRTAGSRASHAWQSAQSERPSSCGLCACGHQHVAAVCASGRFMSRMTPGLPCNWLLHTP